MARAQRTRVCHTCHTVFTCLAHHECESALYRARSRRGAVDKSEDLSWYGLLMDKVKHKAQQ